MKTRGRSHHQKSKQHQVTILVVTIILAAVVVLIIKGYNIDIFGFNGYSITTISKTINRVTPPTTTTTTVLQPGKKLWDWMQLLFIPVVLAIAGFWFNHRERKAAELRTENERKAAELRAEADREISLDNQHEAALQAYIDNISALLLEMDLREPVELDKVRTIARVRTLTVLPRCDGRRKAIVLQFLCESDLIDKDKKIVDLDGADLSEADLFRVQLSKADLSKANLSRANLTEANLIEAILSGTVLIEAKLRSAWLFGTDLHGADLSKADLTGTKVTKEQLDKAKSLEGATMPDGSIHS